MHVLALPSACHGQNCVCAAQRKQWGEEKATSKETTVSQQPLANFRGDLAIALTNRTEESKSFSPWLNTQANVTDRSQFNLY